MLEILEIIEMHSEKLTINKKLVNLLNIFSNLLFSIIFLMINILKIRNIFNFF